MRWDAVGWDGMQRDGMGDLTVHILLQVLCRAGEALHQHLTSTDTITSITQLYGEPSPGTGKVSGGDGYECTARKAAGFGMLMPLLPPAGRWGVMAKS